MKREIGLGDILVLSGVVLVFAFLLISVITAPSQLTNTWTIINSIVLILLTLGCGALFVMNLMGKVEQKMLNVLYLFAGFIIILHCALFNITSYIPGKDGMEFYVFVGALLIGAGTYIVQNGTKVIGGAKKG